MFYLLLILSGVFLVRTIYNFTSKVTVPPVGDYLYLAKNLIASQDKTQNSNIKTQFMEFVVELGKRSLNDKKGIGYFWLPQLGSIFILSNSSLVNQFYDKKNNSSFNQLRFFNRLAIILGPDNLMSSPLFSSIHTNVRKSIFNRNENFIPHLAGLVNDFFVEYFKQNRVMPIGEVMNALSSPH